MKNKELTKEKSKEIAKVAFCHFCQRNDSECCSGEIFHECDILDEFSYDFDNAYSIN